MLLDKPGGLPLALAQAGAYLRQTNMTVERYIRHYDETWDTLMRYQNRYPLQEYAEKSVLNTWKLSYDQVLTVKPEAARLLDQWAFLHTGDVSYEMAEACSPMIKEDESAAGDVGTIAIDELTFEDSLSVLTQYSLINAVDGTASFSIHPVLHEWSLHNVPDQTTREQLCSRAIRMIAKRIPASEDTDRFSRGRRLLLHSRMAANRQRRLPAIKNLEDEVFAIACFMQDWESSQAVENFYQYVLKGHEEAWGVDHASTLPTINDLGLLYADQGKTKEAEEMYVLALRGKEEAWGAKHTSTLSTSTLSTMNNLAVLYANQGKTKESEEMYVRVLRGKEEVSGAKHTSTLSTINNLAILYATQGKAEEAEEMYLRALRGYEEAWGPKHVSTLDAINNLAILYASQGKIKEAEEMYLRVLIGYDEGLGANHVSTLDTVNNLAVLYKNQDKIEEAEEMFLRALKGYEEVWGANNISTLSTVNNLGNLYSNQGKTKEAEAMYFRALRGYKVWGAKHASSLDTSNNLGLLYSNQGKLKEAEEMYMQALRGFEEVWGANHTSTLDTAYNPGNLYRDQGEVMKAKEMYRRAVEGYRNVQGDHEADIAYLQEQLSILAFTDRMADRNCLPAYESSSNPRPETQHTTCAALDDAVGSQNSAREAHVKHRKRDFLLQRFKK